MIILKILIAICFAVVYHEIIFSFMNIMSLKSTPGFRNIENEQVKSYVQKQLIKIYYIQYVASAIVSLFLGIVTTWALWLE